MKITDDADTFAYPLADVPDLEGGTWVNHRGIPLTRDVIARVDNAALAQMYASEADMSINEPKIDNATKLAWQLGWRNPRIAGGLTHVEDSS